MAKRLQWVNYPDADKQIGTINVKRSKLVDSDVGSVNVMSTTVYVRVKFKKKDGNLPATLTIKPNGGNAPYTATEKANTPGIYAPGVTSLTTVGSNGIAKFPVKVTPAGGDRFTFEAKSQKGTVVKCPDEIETRRKLYYQVVRMSRASGLSGAMLSRFQDQFWKPAKKLYIKLQQYSAGKTIANRVNFDDTDGAVAAAVKTAARAVYNKSKAPYSVLAILVNKNCIPAWEIQSVPVAFNGTPYDLALGMPLFHFADPAVAWFSYMTFTPAGAGPIAIAQASVTIVNQMTLQIDTSALPHGNGTLDYKVKIVEIEGMGLSLPTENLVTVATRNLDGTKVPAGTIAAILTHEVGHKIGMVPGPQGDPDLDQQGSYYDGRGHQGPHCRHPAPLEPDYMAANPVPAPKCTMFGDIRTNTAKFCVHCHKSVRKLDVTPERKVGLATQF